MKPVFRKLKKLSEKQRKDILIKFLIFLGLTIILSFFFPRGKSFVINYKVGDITSEEIVARFNYPILKDSEKLQVDIAEALRSEPFQFDRNQSIVDEQIEKIQTFITDVEKIHKQRKNYEEGKILLFEYRYTPEFDKALSKATRDSIALSELVTAFEKKYPFNLNTPQWNSFLDKKQPNGDPIDYDQFLKTILTICRDRWAEGLFDIAKSEIISEQVEIILEDVPELLDIGDFNDLEEAWTKARVSINRAYPNEDDILRDIGYKVIVEFLQSNVLFDKETTERHQQDRTAKVPRFHGIVMKNERIVDANTRVTPEIYQKLVSYKNEWEKREKFETGFFVILPWIGRFLLVCIILFLFFSFLQIYRDSLFKENQILLLFSSVFVLMVAISYLFVFTLNLSEYLIPLTVSAMVITILFDARIAIIFTMFIAVFIAFIVGNKLEFVVLFLATSIAAVYAVRNLRTRTQLYYAILYIILSGILTLLTFGLLKQTEWTILRMDFLYITINGVLAPFITYGLSHLFEILFGVTSDLMLLEHSDFNHPLLKRLSQEANGSFNHSVVVGNLAESSANAIGANALLCRVGAYYHDIGKMVRPEYFTENQFRGENKHENLSPVMSSRIIKNHVKEGIKLAKEYHLPSIVTDFIPMHHGTTRIEYFYKKALDEAGGDKSKINDIDFRYSGPKPNSKETGILMICESVEAAIRSLKTRTLSKIEAMVDKIIENRLKEKQLDDCPLTMKDLTKLKGDIQGKFGLLPVLKGIYHIRIEYPEEKPAIEESTTPSSK